MHICIGAVFVWGKNTFGQLGTGLPNEDYSINQPVKLCPLKNLHVKHVECGDDFSVFLLKVSDAQNGTYLTLRGVYSRVPLIYPSPIKTSIFFSTKKKSEISEEKSFKTELIIIRKNCNLIFKLLSCNSLDPSLNQV
jgi:hypothetical protein